MTITRSYINSTLLPTAYELFIDFNTFSDLWHPIYRQNSSDMAIEIVQEMRGLPAAQMKLDGGPIASADFGDSYKSNYINTYYGISFEISRGAVRDNQYKKQFPQHVKQMRKSMTEVKNVNAMRLFNNGFNAKSTGSDLQPLFSTQHPNVQGPLANTFTNNVQFSEKALEDAVTIITSQWRTNSGHLGFYKPKSVLVPAQRQFDAIRVLQSDYQSNSANNAVNALKTGGFMPKGHLVNPYLSNPYNWFVLTDYEEYGFNYFLNEPLEFDISSDNRTYNTVCSCIERYVFGYTNWRGVFGARGY